MFISTMSVECELCMRPKKAFPCESAKKDEIASWSKDTLTARQDLFLCGLCIEDIKVVGKSLSLVTGWNGRIEVTASIALHLGVDSQLRTKINVIKNEGETELSPPNFSGNDGKVQSLGERVSGSSVVTELKRGRGRPKKKLPKIHKKKLATKQINSSDPQKPLPPSDPQNHQKQFRLISEENLVSENRVINLKDLTEIIPERFPCSTCVKSFSNKARLERHQLIHSEKKPFQCESCGKSFRFKALLLDHGRIHSGEKPFKCATCGEAFTHRKSLSYHEQSKHDESYLTERPFQCETCGTGFRQKNHLVDHIRIHSGEKPYACQFCHKKFSRQNSKAKHERTHTGERPFKCDHCKKAFSSSSHLGTHLRTHTGEKPFSCETCGKAFSRKDNLREHERIHSGELPFICDGCGDKFTRKKLLTDHFGSCQPHLLKILERKEKTEAEPTSPATTLPLVFAQQQQQQAPLTTLSHPQTTVLLQHPAMIQQQRIQPVSQAESHHPEQTIQLQSIPLMEQHIPRQTTAEDLFQNGRHDQERYILLHNAVGTDGSDLDPTNIKVQVYSIL